MGLIKCPDCGNMVSDRAAACPSCGCPADAFGSAPFSQGNAGTEPDLETQICSFIAYPLYRSYDREDLLLANMRVIEYLKSRLSGVRPVTFFSLENSDLAKSVVGHEFTFPYVFVTSSFRYHLDYKSFTLTRSDGNKVTRYYDRNTLPSEYAPRIEVISDNEAEVIDLIEKINNIFRVPVSFSVPFLEVKDEYLTFSCETESVEMARDIYSGGKTVFLHKTVVFKKVQWASYIDDKINPCKNEAVNLLRKLQYAQFCLRYSELATTPEEKDHYRVSWEKACAEANLPNDFYMYGKIVSLRDFDGLNYLINALDENVTRTIDDILEEIKAKVTEMYMEEQRQAQEDAYYESRYDTGRPSILGDILKTAAGVALGNKLSEKLDKKDKR